MKLPKKISPDNLVETIVEIRMIPLCNPELWLGMVSVRLKDIGYKFVQFSQSLLGKDENDQSQRDSVCFFVKSDIRFIMQNNSLIFNCNLGKYVGWDVYSSEIKQVINAVQESGIANCFDRTSIRYISEYKDTPILDHIKGTINIGESKLGLNNQELKLSRQEDNIKVFVSLSNLKKYNTTNGERKVSLFDVNIYENFAESCSADDIMISLNKIHQIEKEVFFGLLKDDFIETLNPEY